MFLFLKISICLSDLTTKGLVPFRHHATGFSFLDEVMSRIAGGKISRGTFFGDVLIETFKSRLNTIVVNTQMWEISKLVSSSEKAVSFQVVKFIIFMSLSSKLNLNNSEELMLFS